MRIAVDYDKTFTAHKSFFLDLMIKAKDLGWDACIVTVRSPELDWTEDFDQLEAWQDIKTYCTDGEPKREFMDNLGLHVDIWIDDKPETIINGSGWEKDSPELAAWRAAGRP